MQGLNNLKRIIPPGFMTIALGGVYLACMAPGLSWANFGADGGDLITAAATGGVAHPTGYPFYLLLARLFQILPVGSLAYRTNLLSAIAAVSAAVMVYSLVTRSLSSSDPPHYWLAGLASGLAFGISPLVWSQAVITEVYTLHSLFVALLLYLSMGLFPFQYGQKRTDLLLGLTFGLSMGNHITTIILLPVLCFGTIHWHPTPTQGSEKTSKLHLDGRSILRRLTWLVFGLMVYLTLPLRALSQPPVNWGNPVDLNGFIWLVSGKLYQGQLFVLTLSSILERARVLVSIILGQFGIPGLIIGLIGLIVFFKPTRLNLITLWLVAASSAFAIVYATMDAFLYLIPAVLCFTIWIGVGLARMMEVSSRRFRIIGPLIGLVFVLVLTFQTWNNWHQVDASQDQQAERFGEDVLLRAPINAIVFAKGDRAVFTLWYYQFTLQDRLDLLIVASDLLPFEWYQKTLRSTYPDLNLPDPAPFSETVVVANPERPVCYIQYIQSEAINCFPARQLK
jgi:hypothetical protein